MRMVPLLDENQHIETVRPRGCYLHGRLEKEMGYDIFGIIKRDVPSEYISDDSVYMNNFPEGLYLCSCMDIPCIFFFWRSKFGEEHGLVITQDESDDIKIEVLKLYSTKSNVI